MASEMLQREDVSVYVVAGVPKSFKKKLQKFVDAESKSSGDTMLLDDDMTEWVVARLRGEKRRRHEQTPASSALWRAFRALSAARYHLQDPDAQAEVRDLRNRIEELWRDVSPLHDLGEDEDGEDIDGEADNGKADEDAAD
jgi:molybdopterin-biosynthesis enzyme MoeA-like protein